VKTVFVASSGTGIGKTLVTAALGWQLRHAGKSVRILKPVISGYSPETHRDSDTAILLQSLESPESVATIDAMSPWRFAAPLSPDMAAARENRSLNLDAIVDCCRAAAGGNEDYLLIEGVGGVMVPLTDKDTVLDWMAASDAPALLVVGSYLGTISHTLTAADAVARRGITVAGIALAPLAKACTSRWLTFNNGSVERCSFPLWRLSWALWFSALATLFPRFTLEFSSASRCWAGFSATCLSCRCC